MEFTSRRVAVIGVSGRHICKVHPAEARRMLAGDQACPVDGKSIQLTSGLSSIDRSAREDHRHSTSSIKSTFIQRLDAGRLIQHKHIPDVDQPIYRLAVTENLKTVALGAR